MLLLCSNSETWLDVHKWHVIPNGTSAAGAVLPMQMHYLDMFWLSTGEAIRQTFWICLKVCILGTMTNLKTSAYSDLWNSRGVKWCSWGLAPKPAQTRMLSWGSYALPAWIFFKICFYKPACRKNLWKKKSHKNLGIFLAEAFFRGTLFCFFFRNYTQIQLVVLIYHRYMFLQHQY